MSWVRAPSATPSLCSAPGPTRAGVASETRPGLDEELNLLHVGIGVRRECHVDVQHVAERRARVDDAQAEAGVAEPPRADAVQVVAAPGTPCVDEDSATDAKQAPEVDVGVEALLEREQGASRTALVAQRVAAQAVVAAEQQGIHRVGPAARLQRRGSRPSP